MFHFYLPCMDQAHYMPPKRAKILSAPRDLLFCVCCMQGWYDQRPGGEAAVAQSNVQTRKRFQLRSRKRSVVDGATDAKRMK